MQGVLSRFTTFGIGGRVRSVSIAHTESELVDFSHGAMIIGRGSNILASDDGYDGRLLLNRYERIVRSGKLVEAGSGTRLSVLCDYLADAGLSGLEWASGIPASVGGAVKMNAGAYGSDIASVIEYADVLREGRLVRLDKDALAFGYRQSGISSDDVVVCAAFRLNDSDSGTVRARMDDYRVLRRNGQPRGKSAGSIFKNPPGVSVGRVLDQAGLKGVRHGGAVISERHANIIVNTGGATAKDVIALIAVMRETLASRGIAAKEEIVYLGDFG